ncbi:ComF family protein [Candidatus Saccharibacteria bacterium]|nr:ComF family protein [Candidatus Saccharibacteria bacterium]
MLNIVKNTTFVGPFDLLAPHSCRGCGHIGNAFCDCCKNNIIFEHENYCPNCKKLNPTGKCSHCKTLPPIFVAGSRQEILGNLIHDYKYHSVRALAFPLADILNGILPHIDGEVIIVPLPTINRHIRTRALDHTYLIAKHLKKLRGKNYRLEKLLLRENNTVQVGANEKDRIEQASHAYKINQNLKIDSSKTYLLLDDVWTTGASMKSAVKKLRQAGAEKIIISILVVNRLN